MRVTDKKRVSKAAIVIAIAAIIVVAVVVSAWWFYLRPTPSRASITFSVSPREVEPSESITVSGSTNPALANAEVTLTYAKPDGSNFTRTTTTDSDGKFEDAYSSTLTDPTGKWSVTAEIEGETSDPATFYIFRSPPIKIGVMRNLLGPGQGMEEASIMAAEEINDAGGVLGRKIVLRFGDEGTDAVTGKAEIERLITVEKVDFVTGSYRSEIVFAMREVAMDHKKIFIMDSATTELTNCFKSLTVKYPCGHCVRCNYDRYKYMFRILPPNSSLVFSGTLIPFLKYHVVPNILGGSLESPVKVAAIIEDLTWTDVLDRIFTSYFPIVFGDSMTLVSYHRPSHTETNFAGILTAIKESGVQLIIHVLSDEAGIAFVKQWADMKIPALPVGVNVLSQGSDMWDWTEGKCEYETIMCPMTRAPITEETIPFWDGYIERWGHEPLFTACGSYMAIYVLAEAIERAGTLDSDAVVVELEKTDMITIAGRFKFTKYHDFYVPEQYTVDSEGNVHWLTIEYAQPMMAQWREPGERAVVYPFGEPYTKDIVLPPWM